MAMFAYIKRKDTLGKDDSKENVSGKKSKNVSTGIYIQYIC